MSKDIKHVQDFSKGDPVPEWLVFVDPMAPTAQPGVLIFAIDCALYQRGEYYWLMPQDTKILLNGTIFSYVNLRGGRDLNIGATDLDIIMPLGVYHLWPTKEPTK